MLVTVKSLFLLLQMLAYHPEILFVHDSVVLVQPGIVHVRCLIKCVAENLGVGFFFD